MEKVEDSEWKVFDEAPVPEPGDVYVSLNRHGEVLINRRTYEALNRPEAVLLKYSETKNAIGLQRVEPLTTNSFPLKLKGVCENYVIRAKPFIMSHNIRYDGTVRFLDTAIQNGTLVLNLMKTRIVKKTQNPNGRRKRTPKPAL